MDLTLSTLAERPGLAEQIWDIDAWPEFMRHDQAGSAYHGRIATDFPEFVLVGTDPAGTLVARAFSVPFALHTDERAGKLPDRGWDQVLYWAFRDRATGAVPDTVSAIEIAIDPAHQGGGLSGGLVAAMRANAASLGFSELVAPVRPSAKHREPWTPMREYAYRTREDGLPHDPWLRVHARAGAAVEAVAPASMTVAGSLAEWRAWTGVPFDKEGWTEVPFALAPVRCEPDHDFAVYVEANVWMRHRLG